MSHTRPIGQHWLADFHGVLGDILVSPARLQELLANAATIAGATIISHHFHHFGPEQGVTGVLVLAESHISIHTWPETQFVALDIFMCGDAQPKLAIDYLTTSLLPQRVSLSHIMRG